MSARPDPIAQLAQEVQGASRLPSPARCREIRREAGVTLDDAARAIGVHKHTLIMWEAGRFVPKVHNARRWAFLVRLLEEALRA